MRPTTKNGQILIEGTLIFCLFCFMIFGFLVGIKSRDSKETKGLIQDLKGLESSCRDFFFLRQKLVAGGRLSSRDHCIIPPN